jgi:hypothetical protein
MESRVFHSPRAVAGALTLAACVIASAAVLAASNGRIATLDERIAGAQKVVVASARSVDAGWRENTYGDRLIVSRVLLDVEETLKGAASNGPIWMELEGGTLDGVTLRVSDLPDLQPGERAVFFLDQGDSGFSMPHLRGQGILKLDKDNLVTGSSLRLDAIRTLARGRR